MKSCEQIVNAMPLARLRVLLNVAIYGLRDESVETAVYHVETTVYGPLSSLMCSIQAVVFRIIWRSFSELFGVSSALRCDLGRTNLRWNVCICHAQS